MEKLRNLQDHGLVRHGFFHGFHNIVYFLDGMPEKCQGEGWIDF